MRRQSVLAATMTMLMISTVPVALHAQAVTGRGEAAGSDSVGSPGGTSGGTSGRVHEGAGADAAGQGGTPATTGTSGQPGALPPVEPKAGQPNNYSGMPDSERWERTHRISKIIGVEVRNREGERIGGIEDMVLDRNGNAAYAIVSTGGFLGLGSRLHAVPWKLLQTHNEGYYLLDMDRDRLRQAPSFDERAWPNFNDERWVRDNSRYFGVRR
ncbi:PRC-barrel domain-containing protein [Caldimonas tepidiphila]|uniref:PRC-barrel domain-containing protein n=1 Tax=Caldimonas tepidiphila TaxID=2315841 RepID=UPI00130024CA|nr:PRC-barrel domain-containing protein [Caldimonas tepidiphila]